MLFTATATKGQFPFSRRSEEIRLVVIYQKVTTAGNRHNYLKHLLGVLFLGVYQCVKQLCFQASAMHLIKKRISQISLMTERRIMTLLGKKLQKKRKETRSNFYSILAKLEMAKNIHLVSIWYHLNVYLSLRFGKSKGPICI